MPTTSQRKSGFVFPTTLAAVVLVTGMQGQPVRLPHFSGFESAEGFVAGPLSGQAGWLAGPGAGVTSTLSYRGTQSVLLSPSLTAAQAELSVSPDGAPPVAFIDVFVRPSPGRAARSSVFLRCDAAQVACVLNGSQGWIHVLFGNRAGGGSWLDTGHRIPLIFGEVPADWSRVTVRLDFVGGTWDLTIDGRLVAVDVGFVSGPSAGFSRVAMVGGAYRPAHFDDIFLGYENPLFADADDDGIDDARETALGLNPAANDRNGDLDGDGLGNIRELLRGTNPGDPDSDGDGLPDGWETSYGLNPLAGSATGDPDADGVNNGQEYLLGRNPTKGARPDTTGAVNLRVFLPAR